MSPARYAVNDSAAGEAGNIVGTFLDADDDWDLDGAVGVDKVGRQNVNRRFHELQDSCRSKKQRAPASALEVFKLVTELAKGSETSAQEAVAERRITPGYPRRKRERNSVLKPKTVGLSWRN